MADSPLKIQISEASKDAMRARDKERLGTLRLALSEIKRIEVDERVDLDDARIITILDKMVKQRRESIRQFEAGGRPELAAKEEQEISVLQEFLPQALSESELDAIVKAAVTETGAESIRDMGKVMAVVKPQVAGRADMAVVSSRIKEMLVGT
ncbi:MAG: GatB/YqeY domain-containing protein [Pseudohongiellaceae bacterium]